MEELITISCDASQSGLGCVLIQNDRPVAYGLKALTDAEYAYAQIEKELLAICYALKKFHTFVYGRHDITVETDHLPLIRILQKPLHQIPLRLQRMRLKLQDYDFKLVAKKGTDIPVADALSRAHSSDTSPEFNIFEVHTEELRGSASFRPQKLNEIKNETKKDETMLKLIQVIQEGWPAQKKDLDPVLMPFFEARELLHVIDGIVFKGERVVVPKTMRRFVLDTVHKSHQGIVKCKQLARDLVYWPGMNAQLEEVVANCCACQENRRMQQKETMQSNEIPKQPWQQVGEDLFEFKGQKYLMCVDYYSQYFEMVPLKDGTAKTVIETSKRIFSTHGIPEKLTSDNGPPFNSQEFHQFAEEYGFHHTTSSPYHPQGNAMAERAIGIAKGILKKCSETKEDLYLALLNYRNTPRDNTVGSPAQRLFGRRTRTTIPTAPELLKPQTLKPEEVYKHLNAKKTQAKQYYDRDAKDLQELRMGEYVRIRLNGKWIPAKVEGKDDRSYTVRLQSGNILRRNRRQLLRTKEKRKEWDHDDMDDLSDDSFDLDNTHASFNAETPVVTSFPNSESNTGFVDHGNSQYSRYGRRIRTPTTLQDYVC